MRLSKPVDKPRMLRCWERTFENSFHSESNLLPPGCGLRIPGGECQDPGRMRVNGRARSSWASDWQQSWGVVEAPTSPWPGALFVGREFCPRVRPKTIKL